MLRRPFESAQYTSLAFGQRCREACGPRWAPSAIASITRCSRASSPRSNANCSKESPTQDLYRKPNTVYESVSMKAVGPSRASLRYGPQQTTGSLRTTPQSMTEDGPMQNYYVGLDVHSRGSVFVVENDAGVIVARGSVPTTVNGLKHLRDS